MSVARNINIIDEDEFNALANKYLPLAGGIMTGNIDMQNKSLIFNDGTTALKGIGGSLMSITDGGDWSFDHNGDVVFNNASNQDSIKLSMATQQILINDTSSEYISIGRGPVTWGMLYDDGNNKGILQWPTLTSGRTWVLPDASGTIALTKDNNAIISITGNYTLPASATQGTGILRLVNRSGSDWTITPDGADTIEGAASQIILDGETFDLMLLGTNWTI